MLTTVREHTITGWAELEMELDAWHAAQTRATFWWRDDDATQPGPRLNKLIEIAAGAPVSLAVIPANATDALAVWVRAHRNLTVLQHGYGHVNHAPVGAKKSEFGDNRTLDEMRAEITEGRVRMTSLFGGEFLPVFVPPWNRFSPELTGLLNADGFVGLSAYGPRQPDIEVPTLNCHADPIEWRGRRGFVGEDAILAQITGHLSARRAGHVDGMEATGLLTHHRDHEAVGWQFLSDLACVISEHPGACWTSVDNALSGAGQ